MPAVIESLLVAAGYLAIGFCIAWFMQFSMDVGTDAISLTVLIMVIWPIIVMVLLIAALLIGARNFLQWIRILQLLGRLRAWIDFENRFSRLIARRLHKDEYGELYRVPRRLRPDDLQVKVRDSTGTYWITVPPNVETAREGIAWSYGYSRAEDYNPKVRA